MFRCLAKVNNPHGMHILPSQQFVKIAECYYCNVKVSLGEEEANGRDSLEVMALAAECDDVLMIECEGEEEQKCAIALMNFVQSFRMDYS
jgi:phosphocarrier protein